MKATLALAALFGVALLLLAGTPGCAAYGCGRYSQAVRGAEGLSTDYLAKLHAYVESGQCKKATCRSSLFDPLAQISDRPPKIRIAANGNASITLAFCFDQGVQLVFNDTRTPKATISVAWGSVEMQRIVLWSRSETARPN